VPLLADLLALEPSQVSAAVLSGVVPGFLELTDPNIFVCGELHDVFEGRTSSIVDLATVMLFVRHLLTTGLIRRFCAISEVDVANSPRFTVVQIFVLEEVEVVHGLSLVPGAALIVLREHISEVLISVEVFSALQDVNCLREAFFVELRELRCLWVVLVAFSQVVVFLERQTNIGVEHELMVALRAFFWLLKEASLRVSKGFQLRRFDIVTHRDFH